MTFNERPKETSGTKRVSEKKHRWEEREENERRDESEQEKERWLTYLRRIYLKIIVGEILMVNQNHSHSLLLCFSLLLSFSCSSDLCISTMRPHTKRKKELRRNRAEKRWRSRMDRRTIELDSIRERETERQIRIDQEQTVPKYQRPRNKRRRPGVLALFLSLSFSLFLCHIFLTPAVLEQTCPKQTFFPPCPGFMSTDRGQKAARVLTKRSESRRRKHERKRRVHNDVMMHDDDNDSFLFLFCSANRPRRMSHLS